jgi:hypothetical protein
MPEPGPTHMALAERNRLLSRTRAISLGIAGGAALAALGLGTAFAHAIPGHSHSQAVQGRPAQPGGGLPGTTGPAPSASPSHGARSTGPARTARRGHPARRHHAIAPPAQPPAPAPSSSAPPPVSSGGS